jgi:hypothetical protein
MSWRLQFGRPDPTRTSRLRSGLERPRDPARNSECIGAAMESQRNLGMNDIRTVTTLYYDGWKQKDAGLIRACLHPGGALSGATDAV